MNAEAAMAAMDEALAATGAFAPGPIVIREGSGRGPLAGLTFAAKDLFDVAGEVTGAGNPDWARTHGPADSTAPSVLALLDAGARLIGKTLTDDLACGMFGENRHYGTPLNSRYPDRVPGGSSSGSASAVAAGVVDFALGTDTGGSVRVPSSFNRIHGLRPSHGRVGLVGVVPMAPSFDTCGWFARDLATLARVGDVLLPDEGAGPVPQFAIAADTLALARDDVRAAFATLFAAIGVRTEVSMRGRFGVPALYDAFWAIMSRQLWNANGRWFRRENPLLAHGLAERFEQASTIGAEAFLAAEDTRKAFSRHVAALTGDGLIVLAPTVHAPAPFKASSPEALLDYRTRALGFITVSSLARLPELVLPAVEIDGGAVGLSLIAGFGRDRQLLAAAAEIEARLRAAGVRP